MDWSTYVTVGAVGAVGPVWTSGREGRHAGRFPLAVERHAMAQVAHLLPGVTTVTAHARYYTLHAAVFAEARTRGLDQSDTRRLLRRAEVVVGAVSSAHGKVDPAVHEGMRSPHGADYISPRLAAGADIGSLSADGAYAQAEWGFWGPYVASEFGMGLLATEGNRTVDGPRADPDALRAGLEGLFALAARSNVTAEELVEASHLCMCRAGTSADGELLRQALIPELPKEMHDEDRRAQTLRMLLRLTDLAAETGAENLDQLLVFGMGRDDAKLRSVEVVPAWTGVVLRNFNVTAWRNLWMHLVQSIEGLMSVDAVGEAFADTLPAVSLRAFVESLPKGMDGTVPLPGEFSAQLQSLAPIEAELSRLVIGAHRSGGLDDRVQSYFQGRRSEQYQQLTPSWLQDRIREWADRPVRDFAIWLTHQLVTRAERIALMKASFDSKSGVFRIPTRVYVRDGYVFRDSEEAGGGVALRWGSALQIMGGIGLVTRGDARWIVTDEGRNL